MSDELRLDELKARIDECVISGEKIDAGIVRGLLEDVELLRRRCDGYEQQRKILAGILGTTGLTSAKSALKSSKLARGQRHLEQALTRAVITADET